MTATTTSPPTTRPTRPARRGRRRLAVLGVSVLAGLATWTVLVPILGTELAAHTGTGTLAVGPVSVAVAAAVIAGAGWVTLAVLERLTGHARRLWTVIAGVVLALSLLGPLGGVGGAAIGGLMALHLVVGLTIIVGLRGRDRG